MGESTSIQSNQQDRHQHSHFRLPAVTGLIGMCHHTQLFAVVTQSCELFCPGWLGNAFLLISAS
jgi:hypothetical protein